MSMTFLLPFLFTGCASERSRPYSGGHAAESVGISSEELSAVEDQFLMYLETHGCSIRPPEGGCGGDEDLHQQIRVSFNASKRLESGKVLSAHKARRGSSKADSQHDIDRCMASAIASAKGMLFPDAPGGMDVSLSLPLDSNR
jgi:hypothetical protein